MKASLGLKDLVRFIDWKLLEDWLSVQIKDDLDKVKLRRIDINGNKVVFTVD